MRSFLVAKFGWRRGEDANLIHLPASSTFLRHHHSEKSPASLLSPCSKSSRGQAGRSAISETTKASVLEILKRPDAAHLKRQRSVHSSSESDAQATLQHCCSEPKGVGKKSEKKMGLSKEQRICILLAIDGAFFLVELVVGYAVHSLALVADAFHMLNDVLSLCVGLWAVRVANSGSSSMYTYGWQRAETLGALVNGVFLVALCVTIFLEAIQRFVEKPEVSNPKLVLIVGCLGLASNILGLFLFHDHSHGHGHGHEEGEHEHGHVHSHSNDIRNAEEGHSHAHSHSHSPPDERTHLMVGEPATHSRSSPEFSRSDEDTTTVSGESSNTLARRSTLGNMDSPKRRRRASSSFGRAFGSIDNIPVHPATFRNDFIQASRVEEEISESGNEEEALIAGDSHDPNGTVPSITNGRIDYGTSGHHKSVDYSHHAHNHNQPKDQKSSGGHGHGHSHGDLNMRGVFLHVMGDALGNIGVIATALIIWLTTFEGRFYFDPAISLVITAIILCSAIPLCKAASRILLQAVPMGMSIDEIRADIESLPRVREAHHVHVWQLSDTKLVASLHVKVDCEVEGAGSASYMKLAREIRSCLHGYGIHSSTIQPEFVQSSSNGVGLQGEDSSVAVEDPDDRLSPRAKGSKAGSLISADGRIAGPGCMLDCEDDCDSNKRCCATQGGPDDGKGQK